MPKAFVLINAVSGGEEELVAELKKITSVTEVYMVYGAYDLMLKVEADTAEKVKETITWRIRRLEKVRSTLTMIVVEG
ncbi:MAG: Lrp/AsnC ligand binding domain-containing protein [Conexivisphaerales archaeon]